jgi:hypothetical protein
MVKPVQPALAGPARIAELRPLAMLGDTFEDAEPWLDRMVRGQHYAAQVQARLDHATYRVALAGQPFVLKLDAELEAGQTIQLKYLQAQPAPTFMLLDGHAAAHDEASLSRAGQLIGQHLRSAGAEAATPYQARFTVSRNPAEAGQLAAELRQAVSGSGLFYEAHLAEFVQGRRSLDDVRQEAQIREQYPPGHLLVKQLGILENQRLLWHGEIWPGQTMHWRIDAEREDDDAQAWTDPADDAPLSTTLSLQLPHLGAVTARIDLARGSVRVALSAAQDETAARLREAGASLVAALDAHAARVAAFAVTQEALDD